MRDKLRPAEALAAYALHEVETVPGMLQSGAIAVLWSLIELQDAFGVSGDVAEIGAFRGRTLILLAHALARGERAFAIDVFGNPPGSNETDRAALAANLERFGFGPDICETIVEDSRTFDPASFGARLDNAAIRLFSVDGDHGKAAVLHDLALAEAVLAPGGVVAADDLFNPWYPSVTEAIYQFLADPPGTLEPIAFIAANGPVETGAAKLLLARSAFAGRYKAGLKLLNQDDLKHCDPFSGFSDVPHFYFAGTPIRRPLDGTLMAILKDIVENPYA